MTVITGIIAFIELVWIAMTLLYFRPFFISKIKHHTDVLHVSSVILHSDNKKTCHVSSSKLEIIILDLDLNNFIIAY